MAKQISYVCDRCGKSAEISGQKKMALKSPPIMIDISIYRTPKTREEIELPEPAEICLKCLGEIMSLYSKEEREKFGCE